MNGFGRGDDKKKKEKGILTKETIGMTLMLFSAILFLIAVTGNLIFGEIGLAISAFLIGLFGYFAYPLLVLLFYVSLRMVLDKKLLSKAWVVRSVLLIAAVFFLVHAATAEKFYSGSYGAYLSGCWSAASADLMQGTGGGIIFGIVAFPVRHLLSLAGEYILFSLLTLLAAFLLLMLTPLGRLVKRAPKARTPEDKPKGDGGTGLSFDDLETPVRASMPADAPKAQPVTAPAPAAQAPAQPAYDGRRASREILFRGDPAADYRNNLIYDRNSAFNRGERHSTVVPSGYDPATGTPAAPASSTYSGSFSHTAEETRPPMPRRVVEPDSDADDFNYPAAPPSFRAPEPPSAPHDFYEHDVETDFSSAPSVYDEPDPILPEEQEPIRPSFRAPDPPPASEPPRSFLDPFGDRGTPADPLARTPAREADEPDFGRSRDGFGILRGGDGGRDDVLSAPAVGRDALRDDPDDARGRERGSDLFSEPSRGRDTSGDDFSDISRRRDASGDDFSDISRRGEEPADDFSDAARGRGRGGDDLFDASRSRSQADLFDDDTLPETGEEQPAAPEIPTRSVRGLGGAAKSEPPAPKKKHVYKKYKRPDFELLTTYDDKVELSNEIIGKTSGIILDTLRNYKIETSIIGVKAGPSVTRYDLSMPQNGTISMMTRYADEIALYLEVSGVNMYPNPEVRGISIEVPVPKDRRATVGLKSILQSEEFNKQKADALTFALGKDIEGRSVCGNITEMTHILVAGMTGSGKSVTMHAMLISMLYKYSPEELRLILIDPKQTEFTIYEGLPHLMINEIITQPQRAVTALNWAIKEMERRYTLFNEKTRSGLAVSKLDEYNANLVEGEERLPKIVIVVDEFGDLMLVAKKEIEERIQRLAQKARAAGIHLVLATQRPDATVITGVIKSNLPTRISLSVDSELNSRIMLDEGGAEHLLGNGDMLIKMSGKARRAQGAFISPVERLRVVNYVKENNEAYFDDSVAEYIDKDGEGAGGGGGSFDGDGAAVSEQYIKALAIVVKVGQASISLIQRKCGVGYNHAGKIIEWMEAMGYISAFEGAKARTVLLTKEEFEAKYGSID